MPASRSCLHSRPQHSLRSWRLLVAAPPAWRHATTQPPKDNRSAHRKTTAKNRRTRNARTPTNAQPGRAKEADDGTSSGHTPGEGRHKAFLDRDDYEPAIAFDARGRRDFNGRWTRIVQLL